MSAKISGLVWDADLEREQKFVLLAMADHADHLGKNIFPSIPLIAWKTGYSDRQVQRIIGMLQESGILVFEGESEYGTNMYRIDVQKLPAREEFKPKSRGERGANRVKVEENNGDILSQTPENGDTVTSPLFSKNGDILSPFSEDSKKNGDITMSPEPLRESLIDNQDSINAVKREAEKKNHGQRAKRAATDKPSRTPDPRLKHPAIQLVRGVTGLYPPKAAFDLVIDALGKTPDGKKFAETYQTWCLRGNKPTNLEGVLRWYKEGVPPGAPQFAARRSPTGVQYPAAEQQTEEETDVFYKALYGEDQNAAR